MYIYTLIFVTVPSVASVYNEYALKSQYDTCTSSSSQWLKSKMTNQLN